MESELTKARHVVVVGLGMCSIAFVEKLIQLDAEETEGNAFTVTVIGEEPHLAYNRVGMSQYFTHRSVETLQMKPSTWYTSHKPGKLTVRTGQSVSRIDTDAHVIYTGSGPPIQYDICVLATGSYAALPPYLSRERAGQIQGVFVYRSIHDLDSMIAYASAREIERVDIIGGGLLGLEAAKAIHELQNVHNVTVVDRNDWVLSRQMDHVGGRMVLENLVALNIDVLLSTHVNNVYLEQIEGVDVVKGIQLEDGKIHACEMVVVAIGITPRDEVAIASGIATQSNGGITVGDDLRTSAADVYAIGECASWAGQTFGLINPGLDMVDILSFNLMQGPGHKRRSMLLPDLSTKLKFMGVNVASFGDYFADWKPPGSVKMPGHKKTSGSKNQGDDTRALTYHDPFSAVYKKYIFSGDGQYLLGGMMVGDVSDFTKVVNLVKKKKPLEIAPSQLMLGVPRKEGESDGDDLDDDSQICSCYNIPKSAISKCITDSQCQSFGELKSLTKLGTGCGGCVPLATSIFNAEMKKAGYLITNHMCPHFKKSRKDLFTIIKIKKLKTFSEVMKTIGTNPEGLGCEICKPAIGSILASLYNEFILNDAHHQNQDTNDRWMANIQRNGTYSVVPRIAAGEITPSKLQVLGVVAEKYGLYTKITGAQRIDLFGANKQDLPDIWEELGQAGFESGHAYGKALRTVKSCVGTSWCRFGVGDSVGLAIEVEERYKGVRAPHKFKGGVSGCVRECAEARSKDFGLIATNKGWNVWVGGNGGGKPRHAELLAADVPRKKAIQILDRFLMLYISTADRLQRTARWIESLGENGQNGLEYLHQVIIEDSLGICKDLDQSMEALVGTYFDEWAALVADPERRKLFRQFSNTDETKPGIESIIERDQTRPADWPEESPLKFRKSDISGGTWMWREVGDTSDLHPTTAGTTSAVINYSDTQIAIYRLTNGSLYSTQQACPHRRAFVLSDGLIGDTSDGKPYISCPLHKRNFSLETGDCLNDGDYKIITFEVNEENGKIFLKLPEPELLDEVLSTSKLMVKKTSSENTTFSHIDIIGPNVDLEQISAVSDADQCSAAPLCASGGKLDW